MEREIEREREREKERERMKESKTVRETHGKRERAHIELMWVLGRKIEFSCQLSNSYRK